MQLCGAWEACWWNRSGICPLNNFANRQRIIQGQVSEVSLTSPLGRVAPPFLFVPWTSFKYVEIHVGAMRERLRESSEPGGRVKSKRGR